MLAKAYSNLSYFTEKIIPNEGKNQWEKHNVPGVLFHRQKKIPLLKILDLTPTISYSVQKYSESSWYENNSIRTDMRVEVFNVNKVR